MNSKRSQFKLFFHKYLARRIYQFIRPLQPILNLKKRTFFDKFLIKNYFGYSFYLYNNAFFWETEFFWQGFDKIKWENYSRIVWMHLSKKSNIILDIGANTGVYSILSKTVNPKARIFSFEPQPNIFEILQINNRINGYDINCVPLALSNEAGTFPFYNTGELTFSSLNTTHGSLNKEWRTKHQISTLVEVQRLDDYLTSKKIINVDLIKIDVETFEPQVIEGYGEYLQMHQPIVLLEIQNKEIGKRVSDLFDKEVYTFFWVNEEDLCLEETFELGNYRLEENWNYLLFPKKKISLLEGLTIKK
jgi:FkbM family methyltransferase